MPSSTTRVTTSTVHLDGLTVRVRTTTSIPAPAEGASTYVLVHGLGMTHRYFDALETELSPGGVVHSIDLPGFGRDPRPRVHLGVEDHADLIIRTLEALGVERCVLVGHSMGGQFVTAAALRAPALVERLVIMGPVVDRLRRTIAQQSLALLLDTFCERPRANLIVLTDYLRTGVRWYTRQLLPMMKYPLERAVEQVACPVLVIRGGLDPVAGRRWCRELAGRAVDGTLVEIPGQGHVVQLGAARKVAVLIVGFRGRPLAETAPFLPEALHRSGES